MVLDAFYPFVSVSVAGWFFSLSNVKSGPLLPGSELLPPPTCRSEAAAWSAHVVGGCGLGPGRSWHPQPLGKEGAVPAYVLLVSVYKYKGHKPVSRQPHRGAAPGPEPGPDQDTGPRPTLLAGVRLSARLKTRPVPPMVSLRVLSYASEQVGFLRILIFISSTLYFGWEK